jgi:hypothetical protein
LDRDGNKAALNLGVWTGKGSFTLPYSKYKVLARRFSMSGVPIYGFTL